MAAANTTTASRITTIKEEEIISAAVVKVVEATVEATKAVAVDKGKIITRDLRPQTPNINKLLSNHKILNKRNSKARLPRKITRVVAKAVRISRKTDHKQLRPNKHLQGNNRLKRRKKARLPQMEAGVP